MLIDFHTHCFPDALASRAIAQLSYAAGGLFPYTDGTADGLRERMRQEGVDYAAVMNIATNPHQMHKVNDFAASLAGADSRLIPFGSVHPDAPDALDEVDRIASMGLRGIKFHPEYQGFYVDEERMRPLYRKISEKGLIVLFHAGCDLGFASPYHGMPENMARALRWLDTPVVAAHWGGIAAWDSVLSCLAGLPLYLDTSMGYACVPREAALRIAEKHGTDRLLFGTDTPWHRAADELRFLGTLGLTDAEEEAVKSGNAVRLLGL